MEIINFIKQNEFTIYFGLGFFGLLIVFLIFKSTKKIILMPELIPYAMHYKNVRAVLSTEDWQKLAKIKYKESNYRCDICGVKARLECHEIWEFNDSRLIQSLSGLTCLCSDCHRVKHIGLARKMGWFGDALYHMAKVNKISQSKARSLVDIAEEQVKNRRDEYSLDLTYLNRYSNILPRKYSKRENENCMRIGGNY